MQISDGRSRKGKKAFFGFYFARSIPQSEIAFIPFSPILAFFIKFRYLIGGFYLITVF